MKIEETIIGLNVIQSAVFDKLRAQRSQKINKGSRGGCFWIEDRLADAARNIAAAVYALECAVSHEGYMDTEECAKYGSDGRTYWVEEQ